MDIARREQEIKQLKGTVLSFNIAFAGQACQQSHVMPHTHPAA